ncbi:MAG: carboxypeptidase-like regulatory domain-containing protein [Flavobacteriaceae bacterium]|nr:carboxypeptidase-like regulatory domain-containing protein [Flavobacteriaceae bacterium]
MKNNLLLFTIIFISSKILLSQQINYNLIGTVENEITKKGMSGVHVINLSNINGVITNKSGVFEIKVSLNDTLYFSYLGYKPLKVPVTNDMMKYDNPKFQLTELAYALEEIIIKPYQLTGFLEIDVKNVPINPAGRYKIAGMPYSGYEAGNRNESSISKAIGSIFNPTNLLYNLFGKNPKQMRKLKKMREDDEIKNLLASKFNREIISQLLKINTFDIEEILRNCNYSDSFIKNANDLQILEAISDCYQEYRVLKL